MELEDFMITAAAALLGFISLFKNLLVFIRWLHATFLRKPKNLCEYGSWAVVTGPIDGIGKALAFELASKGLNLVLPKNLRDYGLWTTVTGPTDGIGNALAFELAYPYPRYFREVDRELMESMLRVNLNAVMWVTKGVIDGMLKKKREAILNIGSASSVYLSSYPLQTLYASTKT
ncbi:very-long-chain 3-oxoacyl-CoA reductase 1-like [Eucalyptus grandis]|uniref:very-long-chain 3-oxoacyl-CoA reductase 1-like n=1 Tax=Eucalyptus grandis TaxID=71139 RepID=UPI0005269FD6|nr:very-long-chain 3-oxoacyl-CoA reductase 1-like [Eucalyptus grandis]